MDEHRYSDGPLGLQADESGDDPGEGWAALRRAHLALEEMVAESAGQPYGSVEEGGAGGAGESSRAVTLQSKWGMDAAAWRALHAVAPEQARRLHRILRRRALRAAR